MNVRRRGRKCAPVNNSAKLSNFPGTVLAQGRLNETEVVLWTAQKWNFNRAPACRYVALYLAGMHQHPSSSSFLPYMNLHTYIQTWRRPIQRPPCENWLVLAGLVRSKQFQKRYPHGPGLVLTPFLGAPSVGRSISLEIKWSRLPATKLPERPKDFFVSVINLYRWSCAVLWNNGHHDKWRGRLLIFFLTSRDVFLVAEFL